MPSDRGRVGPFPALESSRAWRRCDAANTYEPQSTASTRRLRRDSVAAKRNQWSDYWGRILELEIQGYQPDREQTIEYGRTWAHHLTRGAERIHVRIERTA